MKGFDCFLSVLTLHGALVSSAAIAKDENARRDGYQLRPFHIDLSDKVPHMLNLIRSTNLPEKPEYPGIADTAGIDLNVLKSLQKQWLSGYDWVEDQAYMNQFAKPRRPHIPSIQNVLTRSSGLSISRLK